MVERKQWAPVTKKASEAKIGRVLISFAPPSVYRAGSFRGSPYLSRPSRGAYGFARRATTATQQFEGSPDPRGGQVALEHAAADLRPGQTRVRCSPKSVKDSVCRRIAEDGGRRVHGRRCFRRHFWTRQGSRIESCRARSRGLTPHATRSSGVRQSVSFPRRSWSHGEKCRVRLLPAPYRSGRSHERLPRGETPLGFRCPLGRMARKTCGHRAGRSRNREGDSAPKVSRSHAFHFAFDFRVSH